MTAPPSTTVALFPHRPASRAQLVAFLVGGFGVLSGFAIFFLMLERANKPVLFLVILGVASVLSALFEGLKEQIEGHHGPHQAQKSTARYFVFLSVLVVAEFNVMSWEALTQVSASHDLNIVTTALLGSPVVEPKPPSGPPPGSVAAFKAAQEARKNGQPASDQKPADAEKKKSAFQIFIRDFLDVVMLLGCWVLTGAILPVALLAQLKADTGPLPRRLFRGGSVGAFTGAIVAPICLLAYVLIVWLVRGSVILSQPEVWTKNVEALRDIAASSHNFIAGLFRLVLSGMLGGVKLFGGHVLGPITVVLAGMVVVVGFVKNKAVLPAVIVGAAVVAAVIAPLWANYAAIAPMLLRASLVWVVPGLVLGTISPLLRETSEERKPKAWALVAFASAAVLFALTILRFDRGWWLALPAVLFFAMGIVLRRTTDPQSYWLPMAAAMSVLVGGTMLGVQEAASFFKVYDDVHGLATLPSEIKPLPVPPSSAAQAAIAATRASLIAGAGPLQAWADAALPAEERIRVARQSQLKLQDVQRELNGAKMDRDAWEKKYAKPKKTFDDRAKADASWFKQLEGTIEADRELAVLVVEAEDHLLSPLQELRQAVPGDSGSFVPLSAADGLTKGPPTRAQEQETIRIANAVRDFREARTALVNHVDGELAAATAIAAKIKSLHEEVRKEETEMRDTMMRWLELAIAGSVGFWTAISLLVGWSMDRSSKTESHGATVPGDSGAVSGHGSLS